MILQALTPGTTIKFPLSVGMEANLPPKSEASVDTGPIALTLVNGKKTSAIQVDWVPYGPGAINYRESDHDVLSGIFTGCLMSSYYNNGRRRVAHVHTGTDRGAGLDCKELMKSLLSGSYREIFTFKPFDKQVDGEIAEPICLKSAFGGFGCAPFGLVTASNTYHVVYTMKVSKSEYLVESVYDKSKSRYTFA